jgi:hypothetical protein
MHVREVGTEEAAERLGIEGATARNLVRTGRIAGRKDENGRWWIRVDDLESYENSRSSSRAGILVNSPGRPVGAVVRLMAAVDRPVGPTALASLLGRHVGNIRKALALAEQRGWVSNGPEGWVLTAEGRAADVVVRAEDAALIEDLRSLAARIAALGLVVPTPAGERWLSEVQVA